MADNLKPMSFRIPSQLLERIEKVAEKQGFRNKSEMMLYAIRKYVEEVEKSNY